MSRKSRRPADDDLDVQVAALALPGRRTPGESEEKFQAAVIKLARALGWRVAHFRKVRVQRRDGSIFWATPVGADGRGFPDLIMVRGDRIIVAELKSMTGQLSPEQRAWIYAFVPTPAFVVAVWKPKDWNEIERTLQ